MNLQSTEGRTYVQALAKRRRDIQSGFDQRAISRVNVINHHVPDGLFVSEREMINVAEVEIK